MYDELHVDDGWAADSNSADSGEEELDVGEASDEILVGPGGPSCAVFF